MLNKLHFAVLSHATAWWSREPSAQGKYQLRTMLNHRSSTHSYMISFWNDGAGLPGSISFLTLKYSIKRINQAYRRTLDYHHRSSNRKKRVSSLHTVRSHSWWQTFQKKLYWQACVMREVAHFSNPNKRTSTLQTLQNGGENTTLIWSFFIYATVNGEALTRVFRLEVYRLRVETKQRRPAVATYQSKQRPALRMLLQRQDWHQHIYIPK